MFPLSPLSLYQRVKDFSRTTLVSSQSQYGERKTEISVGGGGSADPPDQPDVQHVPSLYEEK